MKAAPFWLAAIGGLLLAAASVAGSSGLQVPGAVLLVLGMVLFGVVAARRSRREGTGLTSALARGVRDALRFAWHLMP